VLRLLQASVMQMQFLKPLASRSLLKDTRRGVAPSQRTPRTTSLQRSSWNSQ
jgi:hypothetical protein